MSKLDPKTLATETLCVQSGWDPENGQPRVLPIYQSTTYKYEDGDSLAKLFDLSAPGHMYSRISNPTVECVENKIAALEGGTGALCTSSGQAANLIAILNICRAGQNIVSLSAIYGGTVNLFAVTLDKMGIEVRFVRPDMTDDEIDALFDENTRAMFGETISNPQLAVLDFDRFVPIAHKHGVPFIVDNTFATPVLCRPFELGADIVTHSTTKYMDGHATVVGGVIVDGGRFDWTSGKYPELVEPDESYHGVSYTGQFGVKLAYITKARTQLMRDLGVYMSPLSAFLLNSGLETLHLRMPRHCENALKVAEFLASSDKLEAVNYPFLPTDPQYGLATKYLGGASGVISFDVRGGREAAMRFMNALKLAAIVVHVADIRTCVLHPASTTHRQLTDEQLLVAGIGPGMVRMSVGIENADDIIADIKQALEAI